MLNQIIQARRALQLTQKDLAKKAGLGQAEVSYIERGRKSPTLDT